MDLKGLAWIGNIYGKFEAMCVEMEEAMYQDTVKYVENQVQTVNQNVKRFCAEVVKDFQPESYIDPVKVAAADLSLNPYAHDLKQIASSKKEPRETLGKSVDDARVISGKAKTGVYKRPTARKKGHSSMDPFPVVYEPGAASSGNLNSISPMSWKIKADEAAPSKSGGALPAVKVTEEPRAAKEKILNPIMGAEGRPLSRGSTDTPTLQRNVSVEGAGPKESHPRPASAVACSSSESAAEEMCVIGKVAFPTSQNQVVDADTKSSESVPESLIFQQERVDDNSGNAAQNSDDTDADMEVIEQYDDASLAETCILVETDNLQFLTQENRTRKSYKKKLREAFSGKKRSTRKEYEQLALKFKDHTFNNEHAEGYSPACPADEKSKALASRTCPEPDEWELI